MKRDEIVQRFAHVDLRDWIREVEKLGEIKRLQGMSWERDIGMVTALLQRNDPSPCAIFEDIPGLRKGFRVLTNFFGARRANVMLGFPPGMARLELSNAFLKAYKDPESKPIPHVLVEDGPVFENAITGDDVDITRFPAPQWHESDGGCYIGTGCYSVPRDPDNGWLNQGTYRVMVTMPGPSASTYRRASMAACIATITRRAARRCRWRSSLAATRCSSC